MQNCTEVRLILKQLLPHCSQAPTELQYLNITSRRWLTSSPDFAVWSDHFGRHRAVMCPSYPDTKHLFQLTFKGPRLSSYWTRSMLPVQFGSGNDCGHLNSGVWLMWWMEVLTWLLLSHVMWHDDAAGHQVNNCSTSLGRPDSIRPLTLRCTLSTVEQRN